MSNRELKVASILLTTRYAVVAIGCTSKRHLRGCSVEVDFNDTSCFRRVSGDPKSKSNLKKLLQSAIKTALELGSQYDAVTIGCSRYIKSTNLNGRHLSGSNYGVVERSGSLPSWTGANLFKWASEAFGDSVPGHNIFIQTDVNLAAIGETHFRSNNSLLVRPDEKKVLARQGMNEAKMREHGLDQCTLAYVKLSDTIDVAVSVGGRLSTGRFNPVLAWGKPRRAFYNSTRDIFLGTCKMHWDCYSGLISSIAIDKRLREEGETLPYCELGENHPIQELIAFYIAQLCEQVNATYFPSVICLGGRLIEDKTAENRYYVDLPTRVTSRLTENLRDDLSSGRIPNHRDILRHTVIASQDDDTEERLKFVQRALCRYPVLYGGLVYAQQGYQQSKDSVERLG